MISVASNIVTCHQCELRQRPCSGVCVCTVSGQPFTQHARRGDCPHPDGNRHTETPPDAVAAAAERELLAAAENPEGWGDHVAAIIHKMGADAAYKAVRRAIGLASGCTGCNERREKLNRFGEWVKGALRKQE